MIRSVFFKAIARVLSAQCKAAQMFADTPVEKCGFARGSFSPEEAEHMETIREGDNVRLNSGNKRLKELIRLYGEQWTVRRVEDSVQCFNGRPRIFIESADGSHTRWVEPDMVVRLPAPDAGMSPMPG